MNRYGLISELEKYNPFSIEVNELCPNKIYDLAINGHDFDWTYTRHARNHRYWKTESVRILMDDFLGYDREDSKQSMARIHLLLLAMEQNMPRDKDGSISVKICEKITKKYELLYKKFVKEDKTSIRIESKKCPTGIEFIDSIKENLHTLSISILHIESDRITLESKDLRDYSAEDNLNRDKEIEVLWEQEKKLHKEYIDKSKSLRDLLIEIGMKDIIIWPAPLTFDVNTDLEIEEDETYIWIREGNKMILSKRKK